jgi:subtilisin family serine protease/flagellar hook assembly protein FlgD
VAVSATISNITVEGRLPVRRSSPFPTGPARVAAVVAATATLALGAAPAAAADRPAPRRTTAAGDSSPAQAVAAARRLDPRPDRVRLEVSVTPGADLDTVLAAARAAGGTAKARIPQLHAFSVEVAAPAADNVAAALAHRADVRSVSRAATRHVDSAPDDPAYATSQGYLGDIQAPLAWDVTHSSVSTLIAVIDSGVDVAHPDLAAKIAGQHNADPDAADVNDVSDTEGHGTYVAGTAAAATDNGVGIAGAGYDARLLAVKVANVDNEIFSDAEAAGIVWAADHGADVMNISLSGPASSMETDAVEYAQAAGVLVVASAGNDATSTLTYPAALPDVLAVGATTGENRSSFSNYGSWVDVGAPGTTIWSTAPGGGYGFVQGTSFSAPLVAGEAALLIGRNPATTAAQAATAITSTTDSTDYGFAHGQVRFRAALDSLLPTTVPTFTAPAADATVSGDVAVSATSTAPSVRFALEGGGPAATVPVAEGVASTTLETYGLNGLVSLTAHDCDPDGCATTGATRQVTVDNGAPTITSPPTGTTVNTASFQATATTPDSHGAVKFFVDGSSVSLDLTAPYAGIIGTSGLTDGAHTLTAVLCARDGSPCGGQVSAPVSFTVASLHPAVTTVAPSPFSPNADGVLDTTTVTYTLDQTQSVVLRIKDSNAATVRGPGALGTFGAGSHTWVWNGKAATGNVVPDGVYTVEITTSKAGGFTGFASRTVKVDRAAPTLASVSGSGTTFYPVTDTYKDTFTTAVTTSESSRYALRVYNSHGTRVRTVSGGPFVAGRHSLTWDGRTAGGNLVPAGTYTYEFVVTDLAGNPRTTHRYTVYVSAKRLSAAKSASFTIAATVSAYDVFEGVCSIVSAPPVFESTWTSGVGYYSNGVEGCVPDSEDDSFALVRHRATLPSHVKYGTVRVTTTGEGYDTEFGDVARIYYLTRTGQHSTATALLDTAYGAHAGPSASSTGLLNGRVLGWEVGTEGGNWYEVKSFTVKYVYYTLV